MPKVIDITKKWGNKSIFEGFSQEFEKGKTTAVMGKSGIGKTTLMSIIANLTDYGGTVEGFGKISYVFQDSRLIPFLTVRENLDYVLTSAIPDEKSRTETINKYLTLTELAPLEFKRADELSGGEKQRVSLVRAFGYPSETVLLDEPFSSLDLGLKMRIIDLYKDLLSISPRTTIFITHSVDEALFIADKIVYLTNSGAVEFDVETPVGQRKFGYEDDSALRAKIYALIRENQTVKV